eukprot:2321853-Prorocentrum_lima.AAC.1
MTSSLVGSEMCIRDRKTAFLYARLGPEEDGVILVQPPPLLVKVGVVQHCLLYTSDAADDM